LLTFLSEFGNSVITNVLLIQKLHLIISHQKLKVLRLKVEGCGGSSSAMELCLYSEQAAKPYFDHQ
jgi:hypothetical protein